MALVRPRDDHVLVLVLGGWVWLDPPMHAENAHTAAGKGDSGGARGASSLAKQSIFTCRHSQLAGWFQLAPGCLGAEPPADELVFGLPALINMDVSRIQSLFTGSLSC